MTEFLMIGLPSLFMFCTYRWLVIGDLIEARKPKYDYIEWLEQAVIAPPVPNLHTFWGMDAGLSSTLNVLSCPSCRLVGADDAGVFPCYEHVRLFND